MDRSTPDSPSPRPSAAPPIREAGTEAEVMYREALRLLDQAAPQLAIIVRGLDAGDLQIVPMEGRSHFVRSDSDPTEILVMHGEVPIGPAFKIASRYTAEKMVFSMDDALFAEAGK